MSISQVRTKAQQKQISIESMVENLINYTYIQTAKDHLSNFCNPSD